MLVSDPTTKFQMQLDYLLPSKTITKIVGSAINFPDYQTAREAFDQACVASDHRYLYIDIEL